MTVQDSGKHPVGDHEHQLVADFRAALASSDRVAMGRVLTRDVTWSFPGDNAVSGVAQGIGEIFAKLDLVARHGVRIEVVRVLSGHDALVLQLHNTGQRGEAVLDEHIALVCRFADGRIASLTPCLSDVPMMDAFFVPNP